MVAKRVIWRASVAVAIVLTACSPARAFYWYNWPGSRLRVEPSLLPPNTPKPGNPPRVTPPGTTPAGPPPTTTPPVAEYNPPPPVGPPEQTPEPSTGLIGLLGLGAVAMARRWRNRK